MPKRWYDPSLVPPGTPLDLARLKQEELYQRYHALRLAATNRGHTFVKLVPTNDGTERRVTWCTECAAEIFWSQDDVWGVLTKVRCPGSYKQVPPIRRARAVYDKRYKRELSKQQAPASNQQTSPKSGATRPDQPNQEDSPERF